MKRLFLASSFKDVAGLFASFADEEIAGKKVTFIATAAVPEKIKFYVSAGRKSLERMGLFIDQLDISNASDKEISDKLRQNEYIYVSGGNTFYLLQELKKRRVDKIIVEQVKIIYWRICRCYDHVSRHRIC